MMIGVNMYCPIVLFKEICHGSSQNQMFVWACVSTLFVFPSFFKCLCEPMCFIVNLHTTIRWMSGNVMLLYFFLFDFVCGSQFMYLITHKHQYVLFWSVCMFTLNIWLIVIMRCSRLLLKKYKFNGLYLFAYFLLYALEIYYA
jgi:hypothetical protein